VPNWLLCRREVSPGAKLCYGRLVQYRGAGTRAFPSYATLASSLGVTRRQVMRYVVELVGVKLVSVEGEPYKPNRYRLLPHLWQTGDISVTSDNSDTMGVTDKSPIVVTNLSPQKNKEEIHVRDVRQIAPDSVHNPHANRVSPSLTKAAESVLQFVYARQGVKDGRTTLEQREVVMAALNEGFSVEELCAVAKMKWREWRESPKMRGCFTAATLFNLGKLPDYVAHAKRAGHLKTTQPPAPVTKAVTLPVAPSTQNRQADSKHGGSNGKIIPFAETIKAAAVRAIGGPQEVDARRALLLEQGRTLAENR